MVMGIVLPGAYHPRHPPPEPPVEWPKCPDPYQVLEVLSFTGRPTVMVELFAK
jgi:hypothetical protein